MIVCCSSATTCGADSAVTAIGADVSHSVAANSSFTFVIAIGDALTLGHSLYCALHGASNCSPMPVCCYACRP